MAQVEGSSALAAELTKLLEARNAAATPSAVSIMCGSLPALGEELQRLGTAAGLALDERSCKAVIKGEAEPTRQCFAHFMLATLVAEQRGHPLWVVK